jgi:membrane associated rhomboid family serine protease
MEKIHNLTYDFTRGSVADTVDSIKRKSRLLGKVAYSILVGVLGTILIVWFLTTFLHSHETVKFLPWIIAFNTAVTGYSLINKTRNHFKYKQTTSIVAGVLNVIITHTTLNFLFFYAEGEFLVGRWDLVLYLIIGIICSELGALLAIKYFDLKK